MKEFYKKTTVLYLITFIGFIPSSASKIQSLKFADNDTVYNAVEVQPQFRGGIKKAFEFIEKNLQYPDSSFKNKIEGKVVVKFIIRSNGKTDSLSILKGLNPELDKEALRLVQNFPDWIPGTIGGKNVTTYSAFPVQFKLKKPDIKTVLNPDTTHILVPVSSIPVIIDNIKMPFGFDVLSINFNFVDSGNFVEPFPLNKQEELVRLYGDVAKNGILLLKPSHYDVFEMTDSVTGIYRQKSNIQKDESLQVFPGGKDEFIRWMNNRLIYPENAKYLNLQETNVLRCIVDTLGGISDISFQNKGFYTIEKALVDALKEIKSWQPFSKNGVKSEVLVSIPYSFHLNMLKTPAINFFDPKSSVSCIKPIVYINRVKLPEGIDPSLLNLKNLEKSYENNSLNEIKFNLSLGNTMIKTILYFNNKDSVMGYPVYSDIDTMPEFPGGKTELYKYLGNNVKYPFQSQVNNESDEILVTFVIMPTGEIQDIVAVKGQYPTLNDEVIKLVKKMPRWKPGIKNGNPVAVRCKLPVKFKHNGIKYS